MMEGGKDWQSGKPGSFRLRGTRCRKWRNTDGKVSKPLNLKTVCSTGNARWGTTFNLINGKILRVAD